MKEDTAILVKGVQKQFKVPHERHNTLKEKAVHIFSNKKYSKYKALKNIDFEIKKGDFFGIVGRNGCGKSTLLKIIANIYQPTKGEVSVNGKIAPFIELGVGFNPELTGRENVFLSGTILGLTKKRIEELYDEIVEFAELSEFMDQKLKNYSSGMQVRLAFSIAVRAEADILLIDEVLAVGDAAFQAKCFDYFKKLKENKKTVVFVSHDMSTIEEFCDKAILIDSGEIVVSGNVDSVVDKYSQLTLVRNETKKSSSRGDEKWTNAEIKNLKIQGNVKTSKIIRPESNIVISFKVKAKKEIQSPIIGLSIVRKDSGVLVFAANTQNSKISTADMTKNQEIKVEISLENNLSNGEYLVVCAVSDPATHAYLAKSNIRSFLVSGQSNNFTNVILKNTFEIS